MNYTIQKLVDINPTLAAQLKTECYAVTGCCQTVHRDLGPFLNEYMYQEALAIALDEQNIKPFIKEYYFSVDFHGKKIQHKHYADFNIQDKMLVECKAVETLAPEHRQQLWNYMRLTGILIGILYNFAPIHDQCERYYLDKENHVMCMF